MTKVNEKWKNLVGMGNQYSWKMMMGYGRECRGEGFDGV